MAGSKIDKVYDLMEKMYVEFSGRFEKLEEGQKSLENRQTKLEIKIEHDISHKINALFEAKDIAEKRFENIDTRFDRVDQRLDRIEVKIDDISVKVDSHDDKIKVIEGGKKKAK